MKASKLQNLSRRERQIMDIVYRMGQVTAADIQENLPDARSYSAVRAMLSVLEKKGHLSHSQDGPRYVYAPTVSPEKAKLSAMENLLHTFFEGSTAQAVAALLDMSREGLSETDLERLERLIHQAKREGR